MKGTNMSVADMIGRFNQRVDSGLYFDNVSTGDAAPAVPRIWVPRYREVFGDHFNGSGLDTFKWTLKDVSSAGAPTSGIATKSQFQAKCASNDEAEIIGLFTNDIHHLDPSMGLVVEIGFKTVAAVAANEIILAGVGNTHDNTADSWATNMWARIEGDDDILFESDDETTNTDDKDSTKNNVAGIWNHVRFEWRSPNDVKVFVNSDPVLTGTTFKTGSKLLQPVLYCTKLSGASTPDARYDYFYAYQRV